MGQAKHNQEIREEKQAIAEQIALRVGILDQCEKHDIKYFLGTDDFEEAYKLGNSLITEKDSLVLIFNNDRKELSDFIKDVTNELSDCCPLCEKTRED